eukprot:scaffold14957_cov67-Phaeocystis_antarctica.AAC.2
MCGPLSQKQFGQSLCPSNVLRTMTPGSTGSLRSRRPQRSVMLCRSARLSWAPAWAESRKDASTVVQKNGVFPCDRNVWLYIAREHPRQGQRGVYARVFWLCLCPPASGARALRAGRRARGQLAGCQHSARAPCKNRGERGWGFLFHYSMSAVRCYLLRSGVA